MVFLVFCCRCWSGFIGVGRTVSVFIGVGRTVTGLVVVGRTVSVFIGVLVGLCRGWSGFVGVRRTLSGLVGVGRGLSGFVGLCRGSSGFVQLEAFQQKMSEPYRPKGLNRKPGFVPVAGADQFSAKLRTMLSGGSALPPPLASSADGQRFAAAWRDRLFWP